VEWEIDLAADLFAGEKSCGSSLRSIHVFPLHGHNVNEQERQAEHFV